jgi:signal transduction histidine kinase/ActR/RegA family two-component response regulator
MLEIHSIPLWVFLTSFCIISIFFILLNRIWQRLQNAEALNEEYQHQLQQKTLTPPDAQHQQTLHLRSEAQFRQALHFLQTVINHIPNSVFIKQQNGEYLSYNSAFAETYVAEDGEMLMDKNHPEAGLFQTKGHSVSEMRMRQADKKMHDVIIHKAVFENTDGTPILLGIVTDITQRKQAEQALVDLNQRLGQRVSERAAALSYANAELARAARLKDEFLANMSHELRTPLNAILTMSEFLHDGLYGEINEEQLKAVKHIEEGGSHLLSLINNILDLSKIEAGKIKLQVETVIVEDVCHSCIQKIKEMAIKKHVAILFASDDNMKTISADERALKQILLNLINNAVKFTPAKGKITLSLQGDEINRVAHFHIIDTGIGIPEDEMKYLFKPFVQLDGGLSRRHEGTGLGLILVYKFTELHGGSVHVESEAGKGSKFTVSLAWQVPSEEVYLRYDEPPTVTKKDITVHHASALVLLAEDNETNIVTFQSGLTEYGYKVIVARNGVEALECLQETSPAVILMDIQMPGMDGLEATKQIRANKELAKIPIIALTALVMPGDKERCFDAGANAYLSKPVNIKRLVEEIEKQLS